MFLFTLSTLINVQEVRGETQVRINKSTEYDKRTTDINKFTGHDTVIIFRNKIIIVCTQTFPNQHLYYFFE